MSPSRRVAVFISFFVLVLALLVAAAPAQGGPACQYDAATQTVLVVITPEAERNAIRRSGDEISYRENPGAAGQGYQQCGIATVHNTDRIEFQGSASDGILIDLSRGHFAPGATAENNGLSEIEFSEAASSELGRVSIRGTENADSISCSGPGILLNGDNDPDFETVDDIMNLGVDGEQGNDVVNLSQCFGQGGNQYSFGGNSGDDKLIGGAAFDYMGGGQGDDVLRAGTNGGVLRGGLDDDFLTGRTGEYSMDGDKGRDRVLGGASDDHGLNGGFGDDVVKGGNGNDRLVGSAGNDRLRGQRGADSLSGSDGRDDIQGGADADEVFGDEGKDNLEGSAGNDLIRGSEGNDHLDGDAGVDECDGGPGKDTKEDCER